MDCQEAQSWLVSHIMGDLEPKSYLKLALEEHLRTCKACSEEYREYEQTIAFIEVYKDEFAAAIESCERKEALEQEEKEQSWYSIEAKLAKNEKASEKVHIFKKFWKPLVAAAASIAIVISLYFVISGNNGHNIPDSPKISLSIPSVKIEKITDGIAQTIPANQEISTNSGQMATLVINSKHRMILNENTSLSINPHVSEENIGCTVNLNYGRIYTQVEHDGNPCIVETANGKAIITGTTFDIEANESKTTLVVAEGSVNFTSEVGSVDVVAGYSSEIFAKSAPLQPVLCDTKQLTAWATGYELETTFAKIEAISDTFDISDLWLTANSGPINLENINYETWIEQKRDWFEREFPSIFQLYDILTVEGIQSEYQELLFTSGILWEFKYPQVSNRQYSFVTSDSLLKVASGYGFDRDWLKKKIPSINNSLTNKTNLLTEQEAFQKWIEQFRNARKTNKSLDSDILLYSLHAGTYLANTRTLIWFYIANEKTDLISENKANLLALLQDEVNEAEKFKEYIIRLFTISENCPCEEFNEIIEKVIDSLTEIMEIEGKVKEYEIGK